METSNHVVSTLKSITKQVIQHRIKYADLVIIDEAEKVLEAVYATGEKYLTKAEKDTIKKPAQRDFLWSAKGYFDGC
ncbi:hypothetical protein JCM19053_3482 [Vibrio sp. JCM 19053]|nr:hypothetical protein JCM19053_3482 [Vibrio sp. JCM 19053]